MVLFGCFSFSKASVEMKSAVQRDNIRYIPYFIFLTSILLLPSSDD